MIPDRRKKDGCSTFCLEVFSHCNGGRGTPINSAVTLVRRGRGQHSEDEVDRIYGIQQAKMEKYEEKSSRNLHGGSIQSVTIPWICRQQTTTEL